LPLVLVLGPDKQLLFFEQIRDAPRPIIEDGRHSSPRRIDLLEQKNDTEIEQITSWKIRLRLVGKTHLAAIVCRPIAPWNYDRFDDQHGNPLHATKVELRPIFAVPLSDRIKAAINVVLGEISESIRHI